MQLVWDYKEREWKQLHDTLEKAVVVELARIPEGNVNRMVMAVMTEIVRGDYYY